MCYLCMAAAKALPMESDSISRKQFVPRQYHYWISRLIRTDTLVCVFYQGLQKHNFFGIQLSAQRSEYKD